MGKFSIRELFKMYLMCLLFSFLLFLVVWLSEILRNIVLAASSALSSGIFILNVVGVYVLISFVFVIIPLTVLSLLLINPKLMKAFLATFGVTEELLEKQKKNDDRNGDTKTEQI